MKECICNSCRNLMGMVGDSGAVGQYECEFGFPSEECSACDGDDCDLTCEKYIPDSEEETPAKVRCKVCGRELEQICGDSGDGEIYCIDCFLAK